MKKILSLVMVVAMLIAVLALVGCDTTKDPEETTTEATTTEATTTEATTTEETTTTSETTTTTETTTLFPVFGRFDFGTATKAEKLGMTSHKYLTEQLTYDKDFISVEYTEDTIIVKALKDHPEMKFDESGAEAPEGYSVTSYALCFDNLVTYDFADELQKDKNIMRVRIKNNSTNNIIAIRYKRPSDSGYATTLMATCMYLQGGEPDFDDWKNNDNKFTCEPSDTFEVYDFDVNILSHLARSGSRKELVSQFYALYDYYVACGGATGSNNWNWMGTQQVSALQFFVLGAYGGSASSDRYLFKYADTRANIVEGATVEIDYIIFGASAELGKFTSNIEDEYNESVSISESESASISKSIADAEAATATTAAAA